MESELHGREEVEGGVGGGGVPLWRNQKKKSINVYLHTHILFDFISFFLFFFTFFFYPGLAANIPGRVWLDGGMMK